MWRWVVLLACGLGTALVLEAHGQEQAPAAPTFRASIDLVDVDVSVLDRHRLPVRGLTAADFTVLEDGRPRPIVAFSAVDLPPRAIPSARWMADIAPDVLHNDLQHEGRLVVLLIDRNIAFQHLRTSRMFAEAVVDQLRPGDLAAVAYSTFGVPQNFTADRARLLAAIRQPTQGLPAGDGGSASACPCGSCSLYTIGDIAEALRPVRHRRKLLLVIGSNISIEATGTCSGRLTPARQRAFRALDAANVTVYAFDPAGMQTLTTSADARSVSTNRSATAELMRRGNLLILPDRTGGRVMSDHVRPADRVAEIFRESESYYMLGFQPAHTGGDGRRFHEIRVQVNRPNLTLQARRGYYGGSAWPEPPPGRHSAADSSGRRLQAAVSGLWPKSDITLAVAAAPVAAPDLTRTTVASVVNVRHVFEEWEPSMVGADGTVTPTTVNVLTGAYDRQGRALGTTRQTLSVTPRQTGARTFEYEVVSRLDLKPGRYELRTAVEDTSAGRSGSVYTYVDVPDYRRAPVALSGLLLSTDPAPLAVPGTPLEGLAPVVPTTKRIFARSDRVTGFLRIYQGVSRPLTPGYLVVDVLDERDTSVYRQETRLTADAFGAGRASDIFVDVPVARLPPGQYVLSVEARHGNDTARRDVRFAVQ